MGAGDRQGELARLLAVVAGADLSELRQVIAGMARDDLDAALLEVMMLLASVVASFDLRRS